MILDATAGNRTMWRYKCSANIIYMDIERKLEVRPTIFADDRCLPFRDKQFDTIFFDPPHAWGSKGHYHVFPRRSKDYFETWHDRTIPRYYGWDRYKTKAQLMNYLFKTGAELWRVLKNDGLLWVKWNEMYLSLRTLLTLLTDWRELMQIYMKSPSQTASGHQTYWLCLEKKLGAGRQLTL